MVLAAAELVLHLELRKFQLGLFFLREGLELDEMIDLDDLEDGVLHNLLGVLLSVEALDDLGEEELDEAFLLKIYVVVVGLSFDELLEAVDNDFQHVLVEHVAIHDVLVHVADDHPRNGGRILNQNAVLVLLNQHHHQVGILRKGEHDLFDERVDITEAFVLQQPLLLLVYSCLILSIDLLAAALEVAEAPLLLESLFLDGLMHGFSQIDSAAII